MKIKQVICFLCSVVMLLSMLACQSADAPSEDGVQPSTPSGDVSQTGEAEVDPFAEKYVFNWMLATQNANPFVETKMHQLMTEKLNISFEIIEYTPNQHIEQVNLKLASRQIPDLITFIDAPVANQYGPEGAFLEISKYLDRIPNLKEKLEANKDDKYRAYDLDNLLWFTPTVYSEPTPIFDYSYNKEAFASVGVTDLSTWDKVYEGLKLIKQKNPQFYPYATEAFGFFGFNLLISSFTEGRCDYRMYGFNAETDEFVFMPADPGFIDAVNFFAKMYTEGLVDPEYSSLDGGGMVRKVRNGEVVMLCEFMGGWTGYATYMSDTNYVLSPLQIPTAPGKKPTLGPQPAKLGVRGTAVSAELEQNPGKLDRALRLLDWLYSEEAFNAYWHHPDVCEMVDGQPVYIDAVYNVEDPDFYRIGDIYFPWSMMSFQDKPDNRSDPASEYTAYVKEVLKGKPELYSKNPAVPFDPDLQARVNQLTAAIEDRFNAGIYEFFEGKRPMSEYDAFASGLLSAGGEELIRIYNEQYAKYK